MPDSKSTLAFATISPSGLMQQWWLKGTLFLSFAAFSCQSHGQCDPNHITYLDSAGTEVPAEVAQHINQLVWRGDTVQLESLYNERITHAVAADQDPGARYRMQQHQQTYVDTNTYCVRCIDQPIVLVDSIDLNHDGAEELIVLRKLWCTAGAEHPIHHMVGGQRHEYNRYEVWDMKHSTCLFSVLEYVYADVAASVSVMDFYEYRCTIEVDGAGTFYLSGEMGELPGNQQMGTFEFDPEIGRFRRR